MFSDDTAVLFVRFTGIPHFGKVKCHIISNFVDLFVVGIIFDDLFVKFEHLVTCGAARLFIGGFLFECFGLAFGISTVFSFVGFVEKIVRTEIVILRLLPEHIAETFH